MNSRFEPFAQPTNFVDLSEMSSRFEHSDIPPVIPGRLAQLGEHLPYKEGVIGSIPIATTSLKWVVSSVGRAVDS